MDNAELIYNANQKPPFSSLIMLGLQHCLGMASTLTLPLIIFSAAGVSMQTEVDLIAASMFIIGIGTILMSLKTRYLGTGYLIPLLCEPAFLFVSLEAVKIGGVSSLFGMTCVAGLFQILFALAYPLTKRLFSIEITGIVILMVGFSLIKPDLLYSLGSTDLHVISLKSPDFITTSLTLLTMVVLVVWDFKLFSRYCLLIGVIVGFLIATWQGLLTAESYKKILDAPFFAWSIPFTLPTLTFKLDLLIPFIIASLALTFKGIGGVITCEKLENPNWSTPEQKTIRKSIFTNGLALLIASAFGGMAVGVANNNIGLASATKITSRYVATAAGALFILFAFIPKIAMIFVIMPSPVIGATLIFVTNYVIVAGIQILSARKLDSSQIFIIGFSLITGIIVQTHQQEFINLSPSIAPIVASPIVMTTLVAITLNLFFNLRHLTTSKNQA